MIFIFSILQCRATSGTKNFNPNDCVVSLLRLESTSELCLGPTKGGHYNEVVLLKRWLLSEISLHNIICLLMNIAICQCNYG